MSQQVVPIHKAEYDWKPLNLGDHKPHNGRVGYQDKDGYGGQVAIMRGCLDFKFFCFPCGRRVGKTVALIFLGLEEQARTKGFYRRGIICTDHTKAREMFDFIVRSLGSIVKKAHPDKGQDRYIDVIPLKVTEPQPDGSIHEYTVNEGGRWYIWSGQPPHFEAIQGFMVPFHAIDVDEMQLQHPDLVTKTVNPMLTDSGGRLGLTGHPQRGRPGNQLFQEFYEKGQSDSPEYAKYGSINMPSEANPFITLEDIKDGRSTCVDKDEEREEYDGLFASDGGGVFPMLDKVFTIEPLDLKLAENSELALWFAALKNDAPMPTADAWFGEAPNPLHHYAMGCDWGKQKDYTVLSVFNIVTNQQAALVRVRGIDYEEQIKWVHAFRRFYNKAQIHGDGNGVGVAMSEPLSRIYRDGYTDHRFGGHNKEMYVRRGQMAFKDGRIAMLDVSDQKMEFRIYTRVETRRNDGFGGSTSASRFGHPPNKHDDFVDAFLVLSDYLALAPRKAKKIAKPKMQPNTAGWERHWQKRIAKERGSAGRRIG